MDITYTLIFKSREIKFSVPLQRSMQILSQFNLDVAGKLMNKEIYHVESIVSDESFQNFLNFWIKAEEPVINSQNAYDYFLLSQEFGIMKDIVSKNINEDVIHISCLKKSNDDNNNNDDNNDQQKSLHDKSQHEEYVAKHLDKYIERYSNDLLEISPTSLYNIFYHPQRVLNETQKAFDFINNSLKSDVSHNEENKSKLFVLLGSLNGDELNDKTKFELFLKKDDHFGFIPKFSQSFFQSIEEQNKKLESLKNDLEKVNNTLMIIYYQAFEKNDFETVKLIISTQGFDCNTNIISSKKLMVFIY